MSADQDLAAALARLRTDRLRFEGLAIEGPVQIVEDALERLLLTPEAQAWISSGISGADVAVGIVLSGIAPNAPLAGLEVKGIDFLLHTVVTVLVNKARRDQAAEAEQARLFPGA